MAQVAFVDTDQTETHLVIAGLSSGLTMCGRLARTYGQNLPPNRERWPAMPAPWCQGCVSVYEGE